MKKSIRIKASGHVVERKIIEKLIDAVLKSEGGDLRDLHVSIPTIAGGVGEKWTSFISFYLIHEKEKLHGLYDKIIGLLEQNGFVLLEEADENHTW